MAIADLLTDFDEMGFAPTTLCENPDEYAREWKEQLVAEIERLEAENERFESNMKSVLEIEKKNVVKEFAEKLKVNAICLSAIEKYHVCNLIDELLKEYEE